MVVAGQRLTAWRMQVDGSTDLLASSDVATMILRVSSGRDEDDEVVAFHWFFLV